MNQAAEQLRAILERHCETAAGQWLNRTLERLPASEDLNESLAMYSAMARRKLGAAALGPDAGGIDTASGRVRLAAWPAADAGRLLLLLRALEHAERPAELIAFLYRQGDEAERAAIVRGLALLDTGAELKELILEAGRANSLLLVTAVALNNPYPQAWYSEQEFNQMVLKALFLDLAVSEILGLEERANPELSRMCEDYYDERSAAGRRVPCDIWLALAPCASPRGETLLLEHLRHDTPEHRCYAARALGRRLNARPEWREELEKQRKTETDAGVRAELDRALT